jgi:hypothetical protein
MATLAGMDMMRSQAQASPNLRFPVVVITFGSPRVGDPTFQKSFTSLVASQSTKYTSYRFRNYKKLNFYLNVFKDYDESAPVANSDAWKVSMWVQDLVTDGKRIFNCMINIVSHF